MASRKKSKVTGGVISALLVAAGAWFHAPILDFVHNKLGLAKNHA